MNVPCMTFHQGLYCLPVYLLSSIKNENGLMITGYIVNEHACTRAFACLSQARLRLLRNKNLYIQMHVCLPEYRHTYIRKRMHTYVRTYGLMDRQTDAPVQACSMTNYYAN